MNGLLGVLGGMGPLATVDFFRKVVEETPARTDQEHIPLIIDSVPQIPCRVAAVLRDGESPLPAMLAGIERLRRAGAEAVAIACNTAHYWYDDLARHGTLPILHIADAVAADIDARGASAGPLGLLATDATLSAQIFEHRLAHAKREFLVNTPHERAMLIAPAIALVKQGQAQEAGALIEQALALLRARGAQQAVLACTELPVALQAASSPHLHDCIDATRALARAAVRWSLDRRGVH